jgi:hypothetical protein
MDMGEWGPILAIVISVLTFITTQRGIRRSANLDTVGELERRIAKLEGDLAACEKARVELIRANQDLMTRLVINNIPHPEPPPS